MECKQFNDLMMRYLDHNLNDEEKITLKQHTDACPECLALFDDFNKIFTSLEKAPEIEPDPDFEKLVLNRIHSLHEKDLDDNDGLIKEIFSSAVILILLLAGSSVLIFPEANFFDLIYWVMRDLNPFIEVAGIMKVIYNTLSGFFSHSISSIIRTIYAVFILAGLTSVFILVKNLIWPGLAAHKIKN